MSSAASIPNTHGYDVLFLAEVPEDLQCVICHLALRDPVQVVACGHRYCASCFENIALHAEQRNTTLLCPVDRKPIDMNKVFEDNGMARMVRNLKVRCGNHNRGCGWEGCLGDLDSHESTCDFKLVICNPSVGYKEVMEMKVMYMDLLQRIGKCEEDLLAKDKEIAHLKFDMKEMKEICDGYKQEIMLLKDSNVKLLNDVDSLEVINEKIKEEMKEHSDDIEELQETDRRTVAKEIYQYKTRFASMFKSSTQGGTFKVYASKRIVSNQRPPRSMKLQKTKQLLTNPLSVYKEQEEANKIVIRRHRGNEMDTIITIEHEVKFAEFSTVAAPTAIVPPGKKVFYEVTFKEGSSYGLSQIGWVTDNFKTQKGNYNEGVGDCANSYGFDGQRKVKWHCMEDVDWGEQFEPYGDKVLGIALDMENGKMLFSLDGDWNEPMGLAFDINKDLRFYPAFSAALVTLFINFGYSEFKYGPPDTSFEKLIDVIQC